MKKRLIGVIAAGGLGAATLTATAGSAHASAPIPCTAAQPHSGAACVLVNDQSGGTFGGISVNGTCLTLAAAANSGSQYYFNLAVPTDGTPMTVVYAGANCDRNIAPGQSSQLLYPIKWSSGSGEDTNFRTVTVYTP